MLWSGREGRGLARMEEEAGHQLGLEGPGLDRER